MSLTELYCAVSNRLHNDSLWTRCVVIQSVKSRNYIHMACNNCWPFEFSVKQLINLVNCRLH